MSILAKTASHLRGRPATDSYFKTATISRSKSPITLPSRPQGQHERAGEAPAKFWEVLRKKSRVRVEHPNLPEAPRTAAGELTAALWAKAQAHAEEGWAAFQNDAQAEVLDAKTMSAAAQAERDTA